MERDGIYLATNRETSNIIRKSPYSHTLRINFLFWKSSDILETARIHDNIKYAETINKSTIWIATQAAYGDITPRYFEIMGSGTLLFCEKNDPTYKSIFRDGENCFEFGMPYFEDTY